ncbi:D-alanyl-D-alanine carboxypeptidase family protein [Tsukamurella sp. PLM1]|uniref:D-alanyl-D-alanine carboxypeptidase family protein n=1 Tax=Tsukamurella sp. PLM1 TaxID=2929795 RepID=UPI002052B001|nr:D-alanyl-D-alanine carboxypeptidase family protein [Tsukamurella sp. PLM1]BDH55164.1 hypothetical protein MTP03_01030 [Tsukamurella sp. PLM1]
MPHDAAHLIVEAEAGLRGGVFGRIADANGLDGLFWPADPAERRKASRRKRQPTAAQAADMARSEYLASLTAALWEVERGYRKPEPAWPGALEDADIEPALRERIFARYDDFAPRWAALPDGASSRCAGETPSCSVRCATETGPRTVGDGTGTYAADRGHMAHVLTKSAAALVALVALAGVVVACSETLAGTPIGTRTGIVGQLGEADGVVLDRVPVDADVPAVTNLDPKLRTAIRSAARAAARDGVAMHLTSGWRSERYQQHLYDDAVRRDGAEEAARLVASPSSSST